MAEPTAEMDTSDAPPPAEDANAAAGFLAPSDLAAAKAQVISKSGKRGWLDWRKRDWDRWGAAPRATAPLEVSEGRAFVLAKVPLKERYDVAYGGEANIHTPHMLIERIQEKKRRLSCVVDATLRRPRPAPSSKARCRERQHKVARPSSVLRARRPRRPSPPHRVTLPAVHTVSPPPSLTHRLSSASF